MPIINDPIGYLLVVIACLAVIGLVIFITKGSDEEDGK